MSVLFSVMTWAASGSVYSAVPKMLLLASASTVALFSAVAAPFALRAYYNEKTSDRHIQTLNASKTFVFNVSAAKPDTISTGFYQVSHDAAVQFASRIGMGMQYNDRETCALHHHAFGKETTQSIIFLPTATPGVTTQHMTTTTTYYPEVVGWQVAQDDPEVSMLLYAGPKPGQAVRRDGAVFNLG